MALSYLVEDRAEYISRGRRILSVLNGSGTVELLPGKPDVEADDDDLKRGERFNPDIDFDPNSFSRMDKFDAVEVGQEYIDSSIDQRSNDGSGDGSGDDSGGSSD